MTSIFVRYCSTSCAIKRSTFKPDELATTFVALQREKRVDGLVLSSGIVPNADTTMEKMLANVERLRLREGYAGYIHLKLIPGASFEYIERAVELADYAAQCQIWVLTLQNTETYMRKLKIIEHISLDGVIQNSADGDDFPYSDWTAPYRSPAGRDAVLAAHGERFDLLLGRRTYDIWSGFWPKAPSSPMADRLNAATKYIATHCPESLELNSGVRRRTLHQRWSLRQKEALIAGSVAEVKRRYPNTGGA